MVEPLSSDTNDGCPSENTDRHLWPDTSDPGAEHESIHVTKHGGIGINVGGYVYVKPLREWHKLAGGKEAMLPKPDSIPSKEEVPDVSLTPGQVERAYQLKASWERPNSQWLVPISLTRYIIHLRDALGNKPTGNETRDDDPARWLLRWLNNRGGLGLEKHGLIEAVIEGRAYVRNDQLYTDGPTPTVGLRDIRET